MTLKTVISTSRRTDIPAFYMPWLMRRLELGYVETENPFNAKKSRVDLRPESVHSLVFWSKNYGPFLGGGYSEKIKNMGYSMFFQFTVNTTSSMLEPGVPSLEERLSQVSRLAEILGPEAVEWRFDPICFYYEKGSGVLKNNLDGFDVIASSMADTGIKRCVTSFLDIYAKLKKKEASGNIRFADPEISIKKSVIASMSQKLNKIDMSLRLCCEADLKKELSDSEAVISKGGCIDSEILLRIHGGNISRKPDKGQRLSKGCTCTESRDIGSYRSQPCFHKCLYCYAS